MGIDPGSRNLAWTLSGDKPIGGVIDCGDSKSTEVQINAYNAVRALLPALNDPSIVAVCIEDQPVMSSGMSFEQRLRNHVIQAAIMGAALAKGKTVRLAKPQKIKSHYHYSVPPNITRRYDYNKQWAIKTCKQRFNRWHKTLHKRYQQNDHLMDAKLLAEYYAETSTSHVCARATQDAEATFKQEAEAEPEGHNCGAVATPEAEYSRGHCPEHAMVPSGGLEGAPLFEGGVEPGAYLSGGAHWALWDA